MQRVTVSVQCCPTLAANVTLVAFPAERRVLHALPLLSADRTAIDRYLLHYSIACTHSFSSVSYFVSIFVLAAR